MADERVEEIQTRMAGHAAVHDPVTEGVPAGWAILPVRWGRDSWSAIVLPPRPKIGWRMPDMYTRKADAVEAGQTAVNTHLGYAPPHPVVTPEDQAASYGTPMGCIDWLICVGATTALVVGVVWVGAWLGWWPL